jgi:hypothetical protein
MTVRDVLNHLDHEVPVIVERDPEDPGIYVWSADWIGYSGWPKELGKYLDSEVDYIRVELREDPEAEDHRQVPMLVLPGEEDGGGDAEKRE